MSIMRTKKSSYTAMAAVLAAICAVSLLFGTAHAAAPDLSIVEVGEVPSGEFIGGTGRAEGFEGRIAVVTNASVQREDVYLFVRKLQASFGAEQIVHRTWPVDFASEGEAMKQTLLELAADTEIRALIINQAVINTNAAVAAFRELRDDVLIVYCAPVESPDEVSLLADLVFGANDLFAGEAIVMQAISMGADTIVHYTFPRHMDLPVLLSIRDVMEAVAKREGIGFVNRITPDPMAAEGSEATRMFLMDDMLRQVEEYGVDTAFFGTSCAMQPTLICGVIETGAIFPQLCCPSPYHAFPLVLGIADRVLTGEVDDLGNERIQIRDLGELVYETGAVLSSMGAGGRLSTWVAPLDIVWLNVAAGYAVEWINGGVPRERGAVDMGVLEGLAREYARGVFGRDVGMSFELLEVDGHVFDNYILMTVDFITF